MKISQYARLVVFPHTVFALPFALISLLVAAQGLPSPRVILLVLLCMVSARNSAMAFNRLVDRDYDARNPRTKTRPIPTGELAPTAVKIFIAINAGVFLAAAYGLNPLAFFLSPVALASVFFYSYTKRFTWLSHWVLGLCLAMTPVGAWVAVHGQIGWPSLVLSGAVLLWVAGFDILYSLQDMEFDRAMNLHSIPAQWGLEKSLWISRVLHAGCIVLFWGFGKAASLSALYFWGLAGVALLLSIQHFLVNSGDSSKIGTAFFTVNGWVSICMLILVSVEIFWLR